MTPFDPYEFLRSLFNVALSAAKPMGRIAPLPEPPSGGGRTLVLGGGKAGASMAAALEDALDSAGWPHPPEGLVVTRYDHAAPTRFIEVVEAAHPTPDAAGRDAAARVFALAEAAGPDDLVVFLMSGGASALLSLPVEGVGLVEKQLITKTLLRSGAPIDEMNRVRQALSKIKGGRLAAAAAPARQVTYAISDVPGDRPEVIGSGPTTPADPSGPDPLAILARRGVTLAPPVLEAIRANTPPSFAPGPYHLIATPQMALEAAADAARAAGAAPMILGDAIEGEAREVAKVMAGIVQQVRRHGQPASAPLLLLSGGETTVTVTGEGRGGRNAEFLLALAIALGPDLARVHALACDTDGVDGVETNAGAVIGPKTFEKARAAGLSPEAYLANNDAFSFFEAIGDLVVTGPTLTNVNDFRAIHIR